MIKRHNSKSHTRYLLLRYVLFAAIAGMVVVGYRLLPRPSAPPDPDEGAALKFVEACRYTPGAMPNVNGIYWKLRHEEATGRRTRAGDTPGEATDEKADGPDADYAAFILKSRNADGGYGLWPKAPSEVEATSCAVLALKILGRPAPDPAQTGDYLKSEAHRLTDLLTRTNGWYEQDLLGMSLLAIRALALENRPAFLDRALNVLLSMRMPRGPYWYVTCARAYGLEISDPEAIKGRLDEAIRRLRREPPWELDEQAYAVWILKALDYRPRNARTIIKAIAMLYSYAAGGYDIPERYRNACMGTVVNNYFKVGLSWTDRVILPEPGTAIFSEMPNLSPNAYATEVVFSEFHARGMTMGGHEKLVSLLKGLKPDKNGALMMERVGWRTSPTMVVLKTVTYFRALRLDVPQPGKVALFIARTVRAKMNDLPLAQIADALEMCAELSQASDATALLWRKRGDVDFSELEKFLADRRDADPASVARIYRALGKSAPGAEELTHRLTKRLDRFQGRRDRILDLANVASCMEGLLALDKGYLQTREIRTHLAELQNPDGGFRRPSRGPQSDIYQTIAALHIMRMLPLQNLGEQDK
ncbi:MAG: prenyltransferase/squalene oxidase repeat-containing protein [Phycisphaerae bacterium]|nr:prenyltransferase/squalene oxidase repeat-containing protein [Phycisphaerae bacterium]